MVAVVVVFAILAFRQGRFAVLAVAGLARIKSVSLEPVSGPTVIPLTARRWGTINGTDMIGLEWPFDRFYLNDSPAPDADKLVAERRRDGKRTVTEVRLLDGVLVRELVKQQAQ